MWLDLQKDKVTTNITLQRTLWNKFHEIENQRKGKKTRHVKVHTVKLEENSTYSNLPPFFKMAT